MTAGAHPFKHQAWSASYEAIAAAGYSATIYLRIGCTKIEARPADWIEHVGSPSGIMICQVIVWGGGSGTGAGDRDDDVARGMRELLEMIQHSRM